MNKYQCHKVVEAMKIDSIEQLDTGLALNSEEGNHGVYVNQEWVQRHSPQVGGYYVNYKDGYSSYSPAEAFEEGYTLLPEMEAA